MSWLKPRLEESKEKKYSALPADYCQLVAQGLLEKYQQNFPDFSYKISGFIYPKEVLVVVHVNLAGTESIAVENFCGSIEHDPEEKKNSYKQIQNCLDAVDTMLEQWLGDPEIGLPYDWLPYEFETGTVFLQHNRIHPDLEQQANELLKDWLPDDPEEIDIGSDFFPKNEPGEKNKWH